ncbi:EpsG family protein [Marinobacter sp. 1-3A]|uniref:EpsG family protein n=1 Tax=Marinobacter sp. 1-3A TaxID=2582920 RepID=UPI00190475F7|nr:EpsG family protein [Marinobacter sp. 1-3A]MBK1872185.1 EpsG family protein [Marinobacter sp. 1-3A]
MYSSVLYLTFFSALLIFLVSVFNLRGVKDSSFSLSVFVVVLYSIFLASRPVEFGTDTEAYLRAYRGATGLIGFEVSNNFELGYNLLMSFFKQIGFNFPLFVFFSSAIFLFVVVVYSRKLKVNEFFVISFVVLSSTLLSLYSNIYRQGLSLSFIFAASYYLYKSKYFGFFVAGVAASLFHVTSIAFLLILMYSKMLHNRKFYIVLPALVFLFFAVVFVYLNVGFVLSVFEFSGITGKSHDRLETYLSDNSSSGVGVGVLLSAMLLVLSLLMFRKLRGRVRVEMNGVEYDVNIIRYVFYVCLGSLFFYVVFSGLGVISRIYSYSIIFEAILSFFVFSFFLRGGYLLSVIIMMVLLFGIAVKFLFPIYLYFF